MTTQGMLQELTLIKAISAFWQSDLYLISVLLVFNLLILPLLELLIILWVLVTLIYKTLATPAAYLMRWLQTFKPWGMLEIFMLGALVALVKLGDLATLVLGLAFWSFSIQIIVLAALHSVFEPFWVWRALGHLQTQQNANI